MKIWLFKYFLVEGSGDLNRLPKEIKTIKVKEEKRSDAKKKFKTWLHKKYAVRKYKIMSIELVREK